MHEIHEMLKTAKTEVEADLYVPHSKHMQVLSILKDCLARRNRFKVLILVGSQVVLRDVLQVTKQLELREGLKSAGFYHPLNEIEPTILETTIKQSDLVVVPFVWVDEEFFPLKEFTDIIEFEDFPFAYCHPFHQFQHTKLVSKYPTPSSFSINYLEISKRWICSFKRAMGSSSNILQICQKNNLPSTLFQETLPSHIIPVTYTQTRPSSPSHYVATKLVAGVPFIQDQGLVNYIEKNFKLTLVERSLDTDEHLVLDSNACMIFYSFSDIPGLRNTSRGAPGSKPPNKIPRKEYFDIESTLLYRRLLSLSLKYKTLYLVFTACPQINNIIDVSRRSDFDFISTISVKIDAEVVIRMSFTQEDTARLIVRACQTASGRDMNSQGDYELWASRDWLYPEETLHELFLLSFPFLNPMLVQQILSVVNLRDLIAASLEDKLKLFPWMAKSTVELLDKYINNSESADKTNTNVTQKRPAQDQHPSSQPQKKQRTWGAKSNSVDLLSDTSHLATTTFPSKSLHSSQDQRRGLTPTNASTTIQPSMSQPQRHNGFETRVGLVDRPSSNRLAPLTFSGSNMLGTTSKSAAPTNFLGGSHPSQRHNPVTSYHPSQRHSGKTNVGSVDIPFTSHCGIHPSQRFKFETTAEPVAPSLTSDYGTYHSPTNNFKTIRSPPLTNRLGLHPSMNQQRTDPFKTSVSRTDPPLSSASRRASPMNFSGRSGNASYPFSQSQRHNTTTVSFPPTTSRLEALNFSGSRSGDFSESGSDFGVGSQYRFPYNCEGSSSRAFQQAAEREDFMRYWNR
eukprot:TRINITY_DN1207_c0_g1_i21.p1 TRINITY_DN1207_c0_g1~~TRINITY_DN1207_c0_g1_i21.p1  ORF type:complete len:795 (+),score=84.02 TRINITY_DN1207_c0_g1_i21:2750-5134(+)